MKISDKKNQSYLLKKYKKPLGWSTLVVMILSAQIVSWGLSVYVRENFTDASLDQFQSERFFLSGISGASIGLMYMVFLTGLIRISSAVKNKFLNRDGWIFLMTIIFTCLIVLGVFISLRIYYFYYSTPHGDQFVGEFFGCILSGGVASVGGLKLFDFLFKKFGK